MEPANAGNRLSKESKKDNEIWQRSKFNHSSLNLRVWLDALGNPNWFGPLPPVRDSRVPKTILGFSLKVKHQIDGKSVESVNHLNYVDAWPRQQDAGPPESGAQSIPPAVDKSWTLSHTLKRMTQERAHEMYKACKARRSAKFEQIDSKDRDPFWQKMVRELKEQSSEGREYKKRIENQYSGIRPKELRL